MAAIRSIVRFSQQNFLVLVIFLAFFARFTATFIVGSTELEHEYAPLVLNMTAGRGFVFYSVDQSNKLTTEFLANPKLLIPSAFKSPVYPFFLLIFVKLFGTGMLGIRLIEVTQAILGCLGCWLIYKIALEKFGQPQAMLAAAGMAFYPLLVYSSTQISDTIIFLTLESLTFWFFIQLEKEFSLKVFLFFSFFFGLFTLARPEGFLYFPFALIWLFLRYPKKRISLLILFAVFCALMIVPWGLRNYFQLGKFVTNTSGGLNLWEGQNRNAVGVPSWYVVPPVGMPETMAKEIFGTGFDRHFEIKQDSIYFRNAVQDMLDYPVHALWLAFRKGLYFWSSLFFGFSFSYAGAKSPIYWLPWLLMLPFFLYGMILSVKEHKKYWVFYLVFLISTAICVLFFVLPRYTMLVYPWVIIFAAHGIWRLYLSGVSLARKVSNGSSGIGE